MSGLAIRQQDHFFVTVAHYTTFAIPDFGGLENQEIQKPSSYGWQTLILLVSHLSKSLGWFSEGLEIALTCPQIKCNNEERPAMKVKVMEYIIQSETN